MKTKEERFPETGFPALKSNFNRDDIGVFLNTVLRLGVEMMNADRGAVLLSSADDLKIVASHNLPPDSSDKMKELSTSVIKDVIYKGGPILTHDAKTDPRFGEAASVIMHQITSIICVPMLISEEVIGALYVDSRKDRQKFTEDNLDFISIFAQMAALAVDYAFGYKELNEERERLQSELHSKYDFSEIIGKSTKMQNIFRLMRRVINSDISVLLEGESGTGKELVARALHYNGSRKNKPFVAQFCGNLAESLLESELFGHKKGSFTGAIADKKGLFEIADGGTFFLDEIADISPTIQTKLLRVLQEGEIRRVGDTESRKVNVRIVSATNKSLKGEVEAGKFREDLFYRLNVITIILPPLREREGDVPILARHFLKKYCEKNNIPPKQLTPLALQALNNYEWPGNVRELENTIERAIILSESDHIDINDLLIPIGNLSEVAKAIPDLEEVEIDSEFDKTESADDAEKQSDDFEFMTKEDSEKQLVLRTLDKLKWNKKKTAEVLGVSPRWLHYKLNEWNLQNN